VHVRPAGVEADTERVTVPVKPLIAVSVIVEVPEAPARIWAGLTAPAAIAKSGAAPKVNVAVAEWTRVPLVPVIVTV
jgi:hypothetical protein